MPNIPDHEVAVAARLLTELLAIVDGPTWAVVKHTGAGWRVAESLAQLVKIARRDPRVLMGGARRDR